MPLLLGGHLPAAGLTPDYLVLHGDRNDLFLAAFRTFSGQIENGLGRLIEYGHDGSSPFDRGFNLLAAHTEMTNGWVSWG